ncbi:MAG TPA: double-strand break repair protein AddB [Xanthobacteraceae bacterium]|nr:double-strand break repair protein AddB [Xanthobacteraceae bacterium]
MSARVFTIPPSAPFLPTLIEALTGGRLSFRLADDPLALAAVTLYLPTRRACRLMREAFLDMPGNDAAILPRIVALGDIDEDEIAFAEAATGGIAADALSLPPALGGLERRLMLAQLIGKWAASAELHGTSGAPLVAQTPAAACALADDLARLIDDMTTRGVTWDKLDGLVPDFLDPYWQLTLRFLEIARRHWPEMLKERGLIEPAERRDRLIKAEAARLKRKTDGPVIAAGSTGSIPATAELIAAIAHLPHGAVVLPGLDTDLDEESWRLIGGDAAEKIAPAPGHPQFAMQALLARIGIGRDAVQNLAAPGSRERVISEVLRPAATAGVWSKLADDAGFSADADAALKDISVIEAANAEDESLAIAVALRQAVQDGKTAALVTPDRALGRRVLAALKRWNIDAEDSSGIAVADTPSGIFARLAAEVALGGLEPVTLLALLKHPLIRPGFPSHQRAVASLERAVLRGPRPRAGSAGLAHALASFRAEIEKAWRREPSELHRSDPRLMLTSNELSEAADLVGWLTAALSPLENIANRSHPLSDLAERHRNVLGDLSRQGSGEEAAFAGPDGAKLAEALDELATSETAAAVLLTTPDYAEFFAAAVADRMVRRPLRIGANIRILGTIEARLTDSDRVVLGGLVEGSWPPESRNDAWLSRPMRLALGLDLPERRVGLSAHDFAQALGARKVILSHAAKIAGGPTVPSRFVQRLAAIAGPRWEPALARGRDYLAWARELDRPEQVAAAPQPAPKPPRAARPSQLSVTAIEDWLRDPYTIYAKYILRLMPLDPVDLAPGAAERGTIIHAAVGEFTQRYAEALPSDPAGVLIEIGRPYFAPLEDFPETRAFWWPRFVRIAGWLAGWEAQRRPSIKAIAAEIGGKIDIPLAEGAFALSGRADRIERHADGGYVILDYKTGSARSEKQLRAGLAPQLTLEAAILRRGGFAGIAAGSSVTQVGYVLLKGGARPGEPKLINFLKGTTDEQADYALQRLTGLAGRFAEQNTPYRSLVHPMWTRHYGDYDHLARVKEWSATGGEVDDIWGGE